MPRLSKELLLKQVAENYDDFDLANFEILIYQSLNSLRDMLNPFSEIIDGAIDSANIDRIALKRREQLTVVPPEFFALSKRTNTKLYELVQYYINNSLKLRAGIEIEFPKLAKKHYITNYSLEKSLAYKPQIEAVTHNNPICAKFSIMNENKDNQEIACFYVIPVKNKKQTQHLVICFFDLNYSDMNLTNLCTSEESFQSTIKEIAYISRDIK